MYFNVNIAATENGQLSFGYLGDSYVDINGWHPWDEIVQLEFTYDNKEEPCDLSKGYLLPAEYQDEEEEDDGRDDYNPIPEWCDDQFLNGIRERVERTVRDMLLETGVDVKPVMHRCPHCGRPFEGETP